MPLPEGLSELAFAGALRARRVRLADADHDAAGTLPVHGDADFCLAGEVVPRAEAGARHPAKHRLAVLANQ
jgi:4-hydroxy-3-polyprenylbenzoate decarboxylase